MPTAAEILATPDKWVQGKWGSPEKGCCLEGACFYAAGVLNEYGDPTGKNHVAAVRILDEIDLPNPGDHLCLFEWNDDPKRKYKEVLAVAKEFDKRWAERKESQCQD